MDIAYRRLRDGGVVFDAATWQTHVLTPAGALILEALLDVGDSYPLPRDTVMHVLIGELDVDPDAPDVHQVLSVLADMGMIEA